jgi:two-component system, chemotaxis family, sensor kinase CheA
MAEISDKAREEFFSEAQEIIETLSRNLLALDSAVKQGSPDPSLINEAFRAVHTLKGLAGLFGATRLGSLSHRLEDLLDALRLGRMVLAADTLDVLFSAVDAYNKVLELEKSGVDEPLPEADALLAKLERLGARVPEQSSVVSEYEFEPGMLAVLTEYEEHRLKVNIEQRLSLYRLRVQFDLATIDRALEQIKEKARLHGEIITYLPTGETTSADSIELDLLMASKDSLATLIGSLGADNVVIEEIPRRRSGDGGLGSRASAHASVLALPLPSAPSRGADSVVFARR